ncbi:MAG: T9SS type A sorting domain-containing protein, partial [Bacteroidia bacterium]|nr:T9SS type A sorting domain-containing protein [Bacteroidia bacterium]
DSMGSASLEKYKSSALGIENYCCNSDRLRISPNPSVDNISIETLSSENQLLQIFDLTGRLVLRQNTTGKMTTINLSGLGAGIYNVCATTKEGELHTRLAIMK